MLLRLGCQHQAGGSQLCCAPRQSTTVMATLKRGGSQLSPDNQRPPLATHRRHPAPPMTVGSLWPGVAPRRGWGRPVGRTAWLMSDSMRRKLKVPSLYSSAIKVLHRGQRRGVAEQQRLEAQASRWLRGQAGCQGRRAGLRTTCMLLSSCMLPRIGYAPPYPHPQPSRCTPHRCFPRTCAARAWCL